MRKSFGCNNLSISSNRNANNIGEGALICNGGGSFRGNLYISGKVFSLGKIVTNFNWEDLKKSILPKKELKTLNIGSEDAKWNELFINKINSDIINTNEIITDNIIIRSDTTKINNIFVKNIDCCGRITVDDIYIDGCISKLQGPITFDSNIKCKNVSLNNIKYGYELIESTNKNIELNFLHTYTEILLNNSDNIQINLKDFNQDFYGLEKKIIITKKNKNNTFEIKFTYSNNEITINNECILIFIWSYNGWRNTKIE